MGNWEEVEKSASKFMRGVEVLALTSIAGQWIDHHLDELKVQAARFGISPDEYVAYMLKAALEWHQGISDEGLAKALAEMKAKARAAGKCTCDNNLRSIALCVVHGPKVEKQAPVSWCQVHNNYAAACKGQHEPDWSKEDDDYELPEDEIPEDGPSQYVKPTPPRKMRGGLYGDL